MPVAGAAPGTKICPDLGSMSFSTGGDQVTAYCGSAASPTFIAQITTEAYVASPTSPNTTAVPPGLVNGSTTILIDLNNAGDTDNGTYTNCLECGTCAEHLAHINDNSNWSVSNSFSATTGGCSTCMFEVKPECELNISCPLIMGGNLSLIHI